MSEPRNPGTREIVPRVVVDGVVATFARVTTGGAAMRGAMDVEATRGRTTRAGSGGGAGDVEVETATAVVFNVVLTGTD